MILKRSDYGSINNTKYNGKNANNSLSVTVKVNVTKEGVFTTTLSKEDVDKIHSYGIKLPTNRLGNEGYFNSIALP